MFQVSFNGDLRRSPPNLSVPSISWTVEQHDNRAYQEELEVPSISSTVEQPQNLGPRLEMEAEAVLRELECPVCLSVMVAGIMQCRQGHCVCSQCVAPRLVVFNLVLDLLYLNVGEDSHASGLAVPELVAQVGLQLVEVV